MIAIRLNVILAAWFYEEMFACAVADIAVVQNARNGYLVNWELGRCKIGILVHVDVKFVAVRIYKTMIPGIGICTLTVEWRVLQIVDV